MVTGPARNQAPVSSSHQAKPQFRETRRNPRAPVAVTLQISVDVPGLPEPVSFRGETRTLSSAGATIVLSDCPPEVFEQLATEQTLRLLPVFTGPLEAVVNGRWVEPPENPEIETPRLCLSLKLQHATWFPVESARTPS